MSLTSTGLSKHNSNDLRSRRVRLPTTIIAFYECALDRIFGSFRRDLNRCNAIQVQLSSIYSSWKLLNRRHQTFSHRVFPAVIFSPSRRVRECTQQASVWRGQGVNLLVGNSAILADPSHIREAHVSVVLVANRLRRKKCMELFRLVRAHAEYTSTHGAVPSKHAPFPQESYTQRAAWIQKHRFAELLNSSAFPARELE